MLAWLLVLDLASAAPPASPPGHYHPDSVGAASAQFRRAQDVAGAAFQDRQGRAKDVAAALNAYEEGLDLLGDRAPADQRARLAALTKTFGRRRAELQAFAQGQLDALDAAFSGALERALGGREATICRDAPADAGPRMQPSFARGSTATCVGPSLDAELAQRIDVDPTLRTALDGLLTATWPTIDVDATPVAAIGAGAVALDVDRVLRGGAGHALAAVAATDEEARLPFEAAIEQGADEDTLLSLVSQAREVTARTAAARAAVAAPVLVAIEAEAAKAAKKGAPNVAWCAQPALLGGCTTPPTPPEQQAALLARPKVVDALARADAAR